MRYRRANTERGIYFVTVIFAERDGACYRVILTISLLYTLEFKNNRRKFSVVACPTSEREMPRNLAISSATCLT